MKNFTTLCLLVGALFIGQHANAYYLEHAVAGTLTLKVTGACAIPKTVVKAYIADISDDARNPLGWGVVTASGHLIALRTKVEGYEIERCQDGGDMQTCGARKIIGKLHFSGKW